jgi:hypothetical protein
MRPGLALPHWHRGKQHAAVPPFPAACSRCHGVFEHWQLRGVTAVACRAIGISLIDRMEAAGYAAPWSTMMFGVGHRRASNGSTCAPGFSRRTRNSAARRSPPRRVCQALGTRPHAGHSGSKRPRRPAFTSSRTGGHLPRTSARVKRRGWIDGACHAMNSSSKRLTAAGCSCCTQWPAPSTRCTARICVQALVRIASNAPGFW